jgi:hypothetical protein
VGAHKPHGYAGHACLIHYAPQIAAVLRERGHDVISAEAEGELRGVPDEELLAFCVGDAHYGLVLSSPVSMPCGAGTIGLFVETLDRLLRERSAEDALRNQAHWLRSRGP